MSHPFAPQPRYLYRRAVMHAPLSGYYTYGVFDHNYAVPAYVRALPSPLEGFGATAPSNCLTTAEITVIVKAVKAAAASKVPIAGSLPDDALISGVKALISEGQKRGLKTVQEAIERLNPIDLLPSTIKFGVNAALSAASLTPSSLWSAISGLVVSKLGPIGQKSLCIGAPMTDAWRESLTKIAAPISSGTKPPAPATIQNAVSINTYDPNAAASNLLRMQREADALRQAAANLRSQSAPAGGSNATTLALGAGAALLALRFLV